MDICQEVSKDMNGTCQRQKLSVKWSNAIDYHKYTVHWMACKETLILKKGGEERHHFEYLTNIEQNGDIMEACLQTARLRWNMEDCFNDQKNRDFEMQHLFSRHSFRSFGNWYQILGPAHNIYQPAVKKRRHERVARLTQQADSEAYPAEFIVFQQFCTGR
jgi:hypothetical protein